MNNRKINKKARENKKAGKNCGKKLFLELYANMFLKRRNSTGVSSLPQARTRLGGRGRGQHQSCRPESTGSDSETGLLSNLKS